MNYATEMAQIDTLARTIYGEARGEGEDGMIAVANVVMNRLAVSNENPGYWWGGTIDEICKKPWQFSCWNEKDPNRKKLLAVTKDNAVFKEAYEIAEDAFDGYLVDLTNGATHYLNPAAIQIIPIWAKDHIAVIGKHYFFRPKEVPKLRKEVPCKRFSQTLTLKPSPEPSPAVSPPRSSFWLTRFMQKLKALF